MRTFIEDFGGLVLYSLVAILVIGGFIALIGIVSQQQTELAAICIQAGKQWIEESCVAVSR